MTAAVNMINLQIHAEDQIAIDKATIDPATGGSVYATNVAANAKHYLWQSDYQTIPLGMDGRPEQFAQKLREALPQVNTLRLGFNEFSFDEDGALHPQYEAFLIEAAAQGFEVLFVYAGGDVQNIGNSGSKWGHTDLSNADAYAALENSFDAMEDAWTAMLDWLDGHAAVADALYGLELMNEPAGYRHSIRENGNGDGLTLGDFVALYADHSVALSDLIQGRQDTRVLVGGWGYSGDFATLADTQLDGQSALDALRAGVGDALVWSSHLYPGWVGTDDATDRENLIDILEDHFAPLAGDAVLITETNAHGYVDSLEGGENVTDFMVAAYDWFAEQDIGLGWFPGAETGGSNFVVIDWNGSLRFLHQHSYAHGMNAYSLGEDNAAFAGDDTITVDLIAGRLRNEGYETDYDPAAQFDAATALGSGFGFAGDDTITGTDGSNDMAYGGAGNDRLYGLDGDDFLFGQGGSDLLYAGAGIDHLFGGQGNDVLVGGAGYDQMRGGLGHDLFVTDGAGSDLIVDFDLAEDRLDLGGTFTDWAALAGAITAVDGDSDGATDDSFIDLGGGAGLTLINMAAGALDAGHVTGLTAADNTVDGTGGADWITLGTWWDAAGERVNDQGVTADGAGGDDTLSGGRAGDRLLGDLGDDRLEGRGGDDVLRGAKGLDTLDGGVGNDDLRGHAGRDRLTGGAGDDHLYGGDGRDSMGGGSGADVLTGGKGRDRLTGGAGDDVFVFASGHGEDTVTDFSLGEDRIDLSDLATGFGDLTLTDLGGAAQVAIGAVTVTLNGVLVANLGADDFVF
ncbi:MAG: M10 family metallopeptidase C-terminal domain-containing protein [Pseudomonadota bacterium]